jgi:HSP20 family molecular chaperone IbpA
MDQMQKHRADVETVHQRPAVAPRVDVYENDNEYLIVADLPGVKQADLKLDIDDDELKLEGTRNPQEPGGLVAGETRAVDYRRKFVVPQGVDREKIDAELSAGVLRLRLPKAEALRPRQISVRVG